MIYEEWRAKFKDLVKTLEEALTTSGVSKEEASDLMATVNEEMTELLRDTDDAVLSAKYDRETVEEEAEETETE